MGYIYTKGSNKFGQTNNQSYFDPKRQAPSLISNTPGSDIDVISNFPWTLTPLNSLAVQETPYIRLREFYLLDSFVNQAFQAYGIKIERWEDFLTAVGSGLYADYNSTRLYEGLYDHNNPTGFIYKLPYFSENYLQTSNSWMSTPFYKEVVKLQQDIVGFTGTAGGFGLAGLGMLLQGGGLLVMRGGIKGAIIGGVFYSLGSLIQSFGPTGVNFATKGAQKGYYIARLAEQVGRGITSSVGSISEDPALDKPHLWNNTTPRTFEISFPLYNTLTSPRGKNWDAQIVKNWEFCYLLTYQNLYNKRNLFTGIPPVFYEIDIPGVHYSKAGYISNLRILNVGNIRAMNLTVNGSRQTVNVPDAYYINFTLTDFFMPSKNFMSSLGSTEKGILDDDISNFTLQQPEEISTNNNTPGSIPPTDVIPGLGPTVPIQPND